MDNKIQTVLSTMILSASGWRGIFAESGTEEDHSTHIDAAHKEISFLMGSVYAEFIKKSSEEPLTLVVGTDARPTGPEIAEEIIKALLSFGIQVEYTGITAAPEIMAYARQKDGFVYISASHNPIGYNGIKFGRNDGGVIPGTDAAELKDMLFALAKDNQEQFIKEHEKSVSESALKSVYENQAKVKKQALDAYRVFSRRVIANETEESKQQVLFDEIKASTAVKPFGVVCDMNGSARADSIDKDFFASTGISFYAINNKAGNIVHTIIPEPENLVYCAEEMAALHEGKGVSASGVQSHVTLGYMPDCDGDRGNIVYWNESEKKARVLKAQEVFALSAMAELAFLDYQGISKDNARLAIAVNDPTSMRIEEIAACFGAKVFRAEVGEANVVNCAREAREKGYTVRILGEGSNGGNITYPAAVRDPLNSLYALIKLLVLRDTCNCDGSIGKKGLFHRWCSLSGNEAAYKDSFTLDDVISTLPVYTTTGVSEDRAILKIKSTSHAELKAGYQKVFETEWAAKKDYLAEKYGFASYRAVCNNGTKQFDDITDFSVSGKGGLKIIFLDKDRNQNAFIWMRGSGTEPVFRVMCDVKGDKPEAEKELLAWHTEMIRKADSKTAD